MTELGTDKAYLNSFAEIGKEAFSSAKEASQKMKEFLNSYTINPVSMMALSLSLNEKELVLTSMSFYELLNNRSFLNEDAYVKACKELEIHPYLEAPDTLEIKNAGVGVKNICKSFLTMEEPKLPKCAELVFCKKEKIYHNKDIVYEASAFLESFREKETPPPCAVMITGREGSGKSFIIRQIAANEGLNLIKLDPRHMEDEDLKDIVLASYLYSALIYIPSYEEKYEWVLRALKNISRVVFLECEEERNTGERIVFKRELSDITAEERKDIMCGIFKDSGIDEEEFKKLSGLYLLNPKKLWNCKKRFEAEKMNSSSNLREKLLSILREEDSPSFQGGAQRLKTNMTLDDLVLPKEQKKTLETICSFAKGSQEVYRSWGFDEKVPYGRGLSVLLYGASGTGKTLAATAIANELELPLYRVDLSQLTSKYIGETQKNINMIFKEAEKSGCILFFDEADALFSRRSDVSDSQDRYSNSEIAYLLQKTEQYEGITILATNLLQNFDEAFRRRITFMVRFPLPDAALRKEMWEKIFPSKAPLGEIDFDLLAETFELSGAGIKNCAVYAAFLAQEEGSSIEMRHIAASVVNEYEKTGKTVNPKVLQWFS